MTQLVLDAAVKRSTSSPAAFHARMQATHAAKESGEELSTEDANQLLASRSNANFLSEQVGSAMHASATDRAASPGGAEERRVDRRLRSIRALAQPENQGAVFTRDIDQGELRGLTHSRRLMSVNERQQDRIGRIRNAADFNRVGGAGSYTRVVSHRRVQAARDAAPHPATYDPRQDADLAPLQIGSIGQGGITMTFDAARVATDVSHPLEVFHNDADSAGRIFGPVRDGKRVGRGSERALGRMNPEYHKRDASAPVAPFSAERAARTALQGQRQMRDIVENPSAETDHNEQIWMKPPALDHVTSVFIQKQLDRPPRLEPKSDDKLRSERDKRASNQARLDAERARLEADRSRMAPPEFVARNATLMSRQRELDEPISKHQVIDQSARLPKELRLPSYWQNGRPPRGYEALESLPGADGLPFADLVQHVPPATKRAMLPQLADANLARARAGRDEQQSVRLRARIAEAQRYHTTESAQHAPPALTINGRPVPVDLPPGRRRVP